MDTILSAEGLRSGYGANVVLRDAGLVLRSGEICGIIGPNGAGKTTLLRTLFGVLALRAGRIAYEGNDIGELSPRERLRLGISYVPQERNVFATLTVSENLELAVSSLAEGRNTAAFRQQLDYVFTLFPRLAERRSQAAGSMSGGEQRMVAIAIGLMARPRVLMLDEPTTGLAPQVVHALMDTIAQLNRTERISTIIVEQNILSMLKIIQHLYIVKDGHSTLFQDRPEALSEQKIWEYL